MVQRRLAIVCWATVWGLFSGLLLLLIASGVSAGVLCGLRLAALARGGGALGICSGLGLPLGK